jgi:Family of unknown function (DUF5678)
MSDTVTPTIHEVHLPPPELPKGEREYRAFVRLLPELLKTHRGRYVAVRDGQVVDVGDDRVAVVLRVWERFGYGPIHVGLVTEQPPPPIRVPHYRLYREDQG